MPNRIQRKRTLGWRKPEGAVVVSRPSRWGNPFVIGETTKFPFDVFGPRVRDAALAVEMFRSYARITCGYEDLVRSELAGKDLVCWCAAGTPCHADVLLEIASREAADA